MARVTVEKFKNSKFELTVLAADLTKKFASGKTPTVNPKKDKYTVVALREIESGSITCEQLKEDKIKSLQKNNQLDDIQDENFYAEQQESNVDNDNYSSAIEEMSNADLDFSDENILYQDETDIKK